MYGPSGGPFMKCQFGKYTADYGQHECDVCAVGSTTRRLGSRSADDCIASVGYYGKPGEFTYVHRK